MPSVAGNGGDFPGSEGAASATGGASRRQTSGSGVGAFPARAGGASPLQGAPTPVVSASESWLVQKLKHEWSSCELGPLLTKERLADVLAGFPHLDTPVKVRLLLAFLSMRKEDFEANKFAVVEIVAAAEKDHEEWVKVGAGIVNQYLFMSRDGGAESGTFLHEQLARASAAVLDAVRKCTSSSSTASDTATRVVVIEDFFCHENAYLSPAVRPELAVQPAAHFTIAADAPNSSSRLAGSHSASASSAASSTAAASSSSASSLSASAMASNSTKSKPPTQRPQLARPLSHGGGLAVSASSSSSSVPMRMASSQANKPLASLPPKKNMSELSSEIRRKADAGRFKRQRSRISVIDIDEVKQIESEKAQKAEEQKKRLKATKDDKKSGTGAGIAGNGSGASGGDGVGGNGGDGNGEKHDGHGHSDEEGHDSQMHESQYSEREDDHHDSDREDGDAAYHVDHRHSGVGNVSAGASGGGGYAPQDGTQVLLHAAFHSTGDVMKEVVAQQQHQQPQYQHQQHDYYNPPRQSAATAAPPQQPLYAGRGFEPEDAHGGGYGGTAYGYGGSGSQFGDQAAPYNDGHHYNNGGFADNQAAGQQLQPQQQQQQPGGLTRYDSARDRSFLDGPPEYWR